MKTSSIFTRSTLLLLAALTGRLGFAIEPEPNNFSGKRLGIEQQVVLSQCEKTTESLAEIAASIVQSDSAEEKARLQVLFKGYAQWLSLLDKELSSTGGISSDDRGGLSDLSSEVNEVAWLMVTGSDFKTAGPEAALDLEAIALKWTGDEGRPFILDTRARALFLLNRREEAVATEEDALKACNGEEGEPKDTIESSLASYRKGELPEVKDTDDDTQGMGLREPGEMGLPEADADENTPDSPGRLNLIAWKFLTAPDEKHRNPAAALVLAGRAVDHAGDSGTLRAQMLDTKARAEFMLGEKDLAFGIQHDAITACGEDDDELKNILEATLAAYQGGHLPAEIPGGDAGEVGLEDAAFLNDTAWQIVTNSDKSARNPAAAAELASIAQDLVKDDKAMHSRVLDTLARATFMQDRAPAAISLEKDAIALAAEDPDPALLPQLQATLKSYEKGELPEEQPAPPDPAQH